MLNTLALLGVLLTGCYFIGLAMVAFAAPEKVARFLESSAGSVSTHFLEMGLRLAIGAAFVIRAPQMMVSGAFHLFGWGLILTTVCLLAVPWRWHRRFALRVVPQAIRKRIYKTREMARADVFDYIEVFYNRSRRHSHLGGISPEAFELAAA